jgi:hypothetical protein
MKMDDRRSALRHAQRLLAALALVPFIVVGRGGLARGQGTTGRVLLAPAGGVSITPDELIAGERVAVAPAGTLDDQRSANEPRPAGDRWWWD